ncbi:MAG: flagellar basal body rod protein FlgC [Desulfobacterales bacterium]|nr:flagellar basal body rod protein FlgC [Desulfobacterales bacterium]MBU8911509.1 flagellar basal body rod protein FlgC [Desulfobacterales bacterium]
MDFMPAFQVCASGLAAQRAKMDVIISNLANVNTTRTPEGGPYRRKVIVLSSDPVQGSFDDMMRMVKVAAVVEDKKSVKMVFDPAHPDANPEGIVAMPDINTVTEMADMITANRAYEACVTAFDTTKNMALKALELGK